MSAQTTMDLHPGCDPSRPRMPSIDHLKPQTQAVGAWLVEHGSVTVDEARELIPFRPRIQRLSARILELRTVWDIGTVREPHAGGTHARYVLR